MQTDKSIRAYAESISAGPDSYDGSLPGGNQHVMHHAF
jgi:hypothetical protein